MAAPVCSDKLKKRIRGIFDLMLSDNKKARAEGSDGKYTYVKCGGESVNSQERLYQEAYDRAAARNERWEETSSVNGNETNL